MKGKSHKEGIKQLQRGMRGHDEDQQKRGTSKNKARQRFITYMEDGVWVCAKT